MLNLTESEVKKVNVIDKWLNSSRFAGIKRDYTK